MKQRVFLFLAALVSTYPLAAQPPTRRYTVTDLGTLPGGKFSLASSVSDNGLIAGISDTADPAQRAVIWYNGKVFDISKPGLLGPNSGAFSINPSAQAAIQAETNAKDPNNENFCAYGTGLKCLPFVWQGGLMTPLPTLGGNNAIVGTINNRGQVSGITETATRDGECPKEPSPFGYGPVVLDYEAVVWGPRQGEIRVLRPLPGDSVGMALSVNDNGEAVGATGRCGNTVLPPVAYGPHAVLWERNGTPVDLGNLGAATINMAVAVNNQTQVTGTSAARADAVPNDGIHAFLWTRERGMRDLGTLPSDVGSVGLSVNEPGDVSGVSFDAEGNPRAFVWHNGVMNDLNDLVQADAPLYLLFAESINNRGEIVGFGATATGDVHAFLASPANGGKDR